VRNGEVIQLAEYVLQGPQPDEKSPRAARWKAVREEFARIAQMLERDANAMASATISPVDVACPLDQSSMRLLQRVTGVIDDLLLGLRRSAPGAALQPAANVALRALKRR
jgi:hypothetical protein